MAVSEAWPRDSSAHALLGLMLEREDPDTSKRHLTIARRNWKSRFDFDEYLSSRRSFLENVLRRSTETEGDAASNQGT